jgi:hypothetical protein
MSNTMKIGYVNMGPEDIPKCSGDCRIRTGYKLMYARDAYERNW